MPTLTHVLGAPGAPHRVSVSTLDNGQGHGQCTGADCGWVHVDVLPWMTLAAAAEHIDANLTPEARHRLAAVVRAAHPAAYSEPATSS